MRCCTNKANLHRSLKLEAGQPGACVRNKANFRRRPVRRGYRSIGRRPIVQNEPNLPSKAGWDGARRRGTRGILRNKANLARLFAAEVPVTMALAKIL